MPETFSNEDRQRITAEYREHISKVLVPAYAKLHDYIRDEYLQNTRESIGQGDVPGGAEYYAFKVRESTTTDYRPEEIHEIGKREAKRIFAEMERVKDEVGFEGDMQAFFEHLRTDSRFYFDKEQDLIDAYDDLRVTVNPMLDALFDVRPKSDYVVRAVEAFRAKSMAAAQHFGGTPDGSRPGIFYVNTYDLPSRPTYMMEAISLHTDIWRANRLVVDTGMHALGWTRQDAIDWMMGNSPITEVDVVAEVERYIAIPSQALSYKIGQLKIRELRTRAEEALGDRFDVREFHNQILTTGALPLVVLEAKIDRWIESQST